MQPGGGFVETTGPAIPQALPPPHPRRNPSARGCLPGFITVPFITACLDNAVVVPIVRPTGMPRRDPYPLTEHSHGENQTRRLRLWTFPRSRDVEYQTRGRKKGRKAAPLSMFLPRAALRVYREQSRLLSPRNIELSLARVERSEMRLETRRKCSAPELRSLNCLLEELIKSILPERLAWGIEGNSCRGLRPILRSTFLTSVLREL